MTSRNDDEQPQIGPQTATTTTTTTTTLPAAIAGKKKILIVVSHPNTGKSYSHKMVEAAKTLFEGEGHVVVVSDLVAENFNPVGHRHDFSTVKDPDFFDYQAEQKLASTSEPTTYAPDGESK